MPETVIRIRAEGGSQAKTEVDQAAGGLDRLGASGGQAGQVLGQLGAAGQIVGTALGGAGMVAGVMAGKYALDQISQSAETAFQAMQKLGGVSGANVLAAYGAGAPRMAALQGAQYGVGSQEAIQARGQLLGTLGAGARTEGANVEALRIGRLVGPGGAAGAANVIGGFMAGNRDISAVGAGNLYWSALRGMGAEGAAALPQIVGAGGEFGFGTGESMALTELLTRQGGSPMMAVEMLRNLGGSSPETEGILGAAGVTQGMGLGERLRRVQRANLDVGQRRTLFGRGIRGMGGVMANLGEFEGLAGQYGAAAAGGEDLLRGQERLAASDETASQEMNERRFRALKEYAKTGKSLAPGQLAGLITSPGESGDIIASRRELGQDPALFFQGVEDAVARGAERGSGGAAKEQTRLEGGF
jgi:hypothetical protein